MARRGVNGGGVGEASWWLDMVVIVVVAGVVTQGKQAESHQHYPTIIGRSLTAVYKTLCSNTSCTSLYFLHCRNT